MLKKRLAFVFLFISYFLLFCDVRDENYSYIGKWKITEVYNLDPQWAEDIYDLKIAEAII